MKINAVIIEMIREERKKTTVALLDVNPTEYDT